ncbi:MAG: metal ABC transporter permease [Lentisphaeria bacterium]|nr:metal ABC transporter permease [Lentisphaeria bacterium]
MNLLQDLMSPEMAFMRCALLVGLLGGVAMGIVGTMVVTRRITSIAGAIAHAVLGGIGAALYLQRVWHVAWAQPLLGAAVGAVAAALLIGLVSLYAREREDTVISAVWAFGMSIGLLFLDRTPGYVDFQGYLFGNILLLSSADVWWTAALDAVIVIPTVLFFNQLLAMSFDSTFAELRGVRVRLLYLLLLIGTALTIVLMVYVVGIILLIALLSLPAAAAGCFARRLRTMMMLAVLFCWLFVGSGLVASYAWEMPSGPVIVLFAISVYLLSATVKWAIGKYHGKKADQLRR